MSSRRHARSQSSLKPTSTSLTNPFKSRIFSKGIPARKLPTHPWESPHQRLSHQQETRSIPEQKKGRQGWLLAGLA
ncbi:MAG: hypothetical protein RLP02_17235, partial [Coleofasciculus sp. C2-GNP5-27]